MAKAVIADNEDGLVPAVQPIDELPGGERLASHLTQEPCPVSGLQDEQPSDWFCLDHLGVAPECLDRHGWSEIDHGSFDRLRCCQNEHLFSPKKKASGIASEGPALVGGGGSKFAVLI